MASSPACLPYLSCSHHAVIDLYGCVCAKIKCRLETVCAVARYVMYTYQNSKMVFFYWCAVVLHLVSMKDVKDDMGVYTTS